ncbi:guanine nucleotide-binding protein G(i) subunit alpha-3-like isoform X2 [Dreissena polymorpha]|uniref:guanine nucleotide-binding protein G(i) subunit alpha-3-like isoform X2 n=1 Tax=Dreissena polymorpha TaxID=45954 RepID=UPI00226406E2|nr:guanine nucleotide-binding protein G(i) subunit alpha-3-like isoform X2 [Dreissena polymorpha]
MRTALSLSAMGKISKDAMKRSQSIDNQIQQDQEQKKNELTLLLLGGAYSGKSTFVKQLRIHYGDGFPEEERLPYTNQVHETVSGAAIKIIEHMQSEHIRFESEELQNAAADFHQRNPVVNFNDMLTKSYTADDMQTARGANSLLAMACNELGKRFAYMNVKCGGLSKQDQDLLLEMWKDEGFQRGFKGLLTAKCSVRSIRPQELYFCSNISRMLAEDYVPSHQDILFIRRPTLGVIEHHFNVDDFIYRVIDVAGQKSQRKKWIHLFENVTVVLFFVSLSAFDENLEEDEALNTLQDSLQTFREVSHNHYLDKTDFLLFLNKFDLFAEKLRSTKFSAHIQDYDGDNTPEACIKYIREQFHQHRPCHKQVYTHVSCATDVVMMSDLLSKVLNIVAEINFRKTGGLF